MPDLIRHPEGDALDPGSRPGMTPYDTFVNFVVKAELMNRRV